MRSSLLLVFMLVLSLGLNAQINFKTEYFGSSHYRMTKGDNYDEKVGDSKGSAMVYQASALIPLSLKMSEDNWPTLWAVSLGGAYVNLNNKNFNDPLVIDQILNMSLGINYIRPIGKKWSMMAALGGGLYLPTSKFSEIRFRHLLGNGGAVFIYHFGPNFQLGGGVAMNNSFGFPMVFPAIYLNWTTVGRLALKIAMLNGIELSVGYSVNKHLSLNLGVEMNGQMALFKQDGKEKMFSHQYITVAFRPEIKINKYLSIPLATGISAVRPAEISNRSLKSLFKDNGYYFQVAPYFSAGLKIGF